MDFASPPAVIEALRGARGARRVRLRARAGSPGRAIARAPASSSYGWRIEPEWVVWLPGVVPGLNLACRRVRRARRRDHDGQPRLPAVPGGAPPTRTGASSPCRRSSSDGRWELPLDAHGGGRHARHAPAALLPPAQPARPGVAAGGDGGGGRTSAAATTSCSAPTRSTATSSSTTCAARAGGHARRPGRRRPHVTLMSPSKTFNMPGAAISLSPSSPTRTCGAAFMRAGPGFLPTTPAVRHRAAEAAYRGGAPWLASCSSICAATATCSRASWPRGCRACA